MTLGPVTKTKISKALDEVRELTPMKTETRKPIFGKSKVIDATTSAEVRVSVATPPASHLQISNPLVAKLVKENSLRTSSGQNIVLFGAEYQKAIGARLDALLVEFTKGTSPVIFELFERLKGGVGEANLPELQAQIEASLKTTWFDKVLDTVHLSSPTKRLKKSSIRIGGLMTSKTKSLLDLTQEMEAQVQQEVTKLISDSSKMFHFANDYRASIADFAAAVEAGKILLTDAKNDVTANEANPDMTPEEKKGFVQKVDLFENRVVLLETVLAKIPAQLEMIRMGEGASLSTLGETANSALQEFNDIKFSLISLSMTHNTQTVQNLNQERRQLQDTLNKHSMVTLSNVAINAVTTQGNNRLTDANNLLAVAKDLNALSTKVLEETRKNKEKFEETRKKLLEVKALLD